MRIVPEIRLRTCNRAAPRPTGEFVLYWMTASRRATWNFAFDRAVERALEFGKPLVVLEALRCDYPWASDRLHCFVIEGMAENARRFEASGVAYLPFVENRRGAGKGLVEALAARSCVVVTDDFPAFFLPRMLAATARKLPVLLEAVDSNGLLPMRASERAFDTAYSFRRHLQKSLPAQLGAMPKARPLAGLRLPRLQALPEEILRRWPAAADLDRPARLLETLPIDHSVSPAGMPGGSAAAQEALARFFGDRLDRYLEERNEPQADATSGLSPYLHWGHVSVHEVFTALMDRQRWSPAHLTSRPTGSRTGWWGVGAAAEAFLDQLVTWRELGFNCCAFREDYDRFESLPDWARATLENHARDPRPYRYSLDEFEAGRTHDDLWNAAQIQLVSEGRMHNYLRMLWGKKILEWSADPREALAVMIDLNNRFAVDGRDPNSYSGILWVLGRYDRPWGPERPIFGTVRYMSSENTARKVHVKDYVRKYTAGRAPAGHADSAQPAQPEGPRHG